MASGGSFDDELANLPPAKKGPPRWMILGGCGCLIPGFLIVATGAWFLQMYSGLINKSASWEALGGVIRFEDSARGEPTGLEDNPRTPVDESRTPGEFELLLGGEVPFSSGVEAYWFGRGLPLPTDEDQTMGPNPLSITIIKLDQEQADKASMARPGTPLHEDRTYSVNGKTLRGRVVPEMVNDQLHIQLSGREEVRGAGCVVWLREGFVDPDEEGKLFDLLAFFQRPDSSDPVDDGDVVRFLSQFDLSTFPGGITEGETAEEGELKADSPAADGTSEDDSQGADGDSSK